MIAAAGVDQYDDAEPDPADPWILDGETWVEPPAWHVPRWCWDVLRLYRLWAGGGMAMGPLPCAGGTVDQPTALLQAFQVLSQADAEQRDTRRDRDRESGNDGRDGEGA